MSALLEPDDSRPIKKQEPKQPLSPYANLSVNELLDMRNANKGIKDLIDQELRNRCS